MKHSVRLSVFLWLLAGSTLSLIGTLNATCLHDNIQPIEVSQKHLHYATDARGHQGMSARVQRSADDFEPIRISPFFMEFENVEKNVQSLLKKVVGRAINKISQLLAVVPALNPLLLARTACQTKWSDGPNKHKCSGSERNYVGEFCLETVKIPDEHLEGFSLWSRTDKEPVKIFHQPGEGINNTDYLLYVSVKDSKNCWLKDKHVIAFAGYCQTDQHGRPISGVINFCPNQLDVGRDSMFMVAIHELLHAMGFSKRLLKKFETCRPTVEDSELPCVFITDTTIKSSPQKLILPSVVKKARQHFGCNSSINYGVLMETKDGEIQSHWDPRMMESSIMVPTVGLPHQTVVDPITLAVFEDSGWYRVNYSATDKFLWGKGEGCSFGQLDMCINDTKYFCSGSQEGCHFLHRDKATCQSGIFLEPCGIFQSKAENRCSIPVKNSPKDGGELFSHRSRCFMANITKDASASYETQGNCYEFRCRGKRIYDIRVKSSRWISCPMGKSISIPGYHGVVHCPKILGLLCTKSNRESSTKQPASSQDMYSMSTAMVYPLPFLINIVFGDLDYHYLRKNSQMDNFRRIIINRVLELQPLDRRRLTSFRVRRGTIVSFQLLPPGPSRSGPDGKRVYSLLHESVFAGNFSIIMPDTGRKHTATYISNTPMFEDSLPTPHGEDGLSMGEMFAMGTVLVVAFVLIIVAAICFQNRCCSCNS